MPGTFQFEGTQSHPPEEDTPPKRNRAVRPGSEASCSGALSSRRGADWRRIGKPRWRLSSLTFGVSPQMKRKLGNGRLGRCIRRAIGKAFKFTFDRFCILLITSGLLSQNSLISLPSPKAALARSYKRLHTFPQAVEGESDRYVDRRLSLYDDRLERDHGN